MNRSRSVVIENPPPPLRPFSRILPERGRLETVVDDGRVRLRSPLRRQERLLCRGRRAHEPQPLEQGPQALAPGVHPHQPPPGPRRRAALLDSIGAPRNDRRPPPRGRPEHPMKAQRVKARGGISSVGFSISSSGSSSRCVAPAARGCGSSNTSCPRKLFVKRSSATAGARGSGSAHPVHLLAQVDRALRATFALR
jgi:hypothetical protein